MDETADTNKQNFFRKIGSAKVLVFILLLVVFGSLIVYQIDLPAADDLARHLINGREILHGHWDVLYKNVYSYVMPDQTFVNHHWLSGVVFYILQKLVGWRGLVVFKIILSFATFGVLFKVALKKANFWLVALMSLPTMLMLSERSALRPESFSYLFIALFLYILFDFWEHPNSKKIYWLVPLEILWVNLHIFFIIGPAMVLGFLAEKLIRLKFNKYEKEQKKSLTKAVRKLAFMALLVTLSCLLNPNLLKGALMPFNIFKNYGMDVTENHNPVYFLRSSPLFSNITIIIFFISAVLLVASFILKKKQWSVPGEWPYFYFFAAVGSGAAAFIIIRLMSAFGMIFLPAITANLNDKFYPLLKKRFGPIAIVIFVVFFGYFIYQDASGIDPHGIGLVPHALDAQQFLQQNNLQGPFFTDYDGGSYLVYSLYPKERDFVDNRPEAFTEDFFQNIYLPAFKSEDAWKNLENKYQFNAIYMYRYDSGENVLDFLFRRVSDPNWALVFADSKAVIFLRNNDQNKRLIEKYKITPDNIQERLGYLYASNDYTDLVGAADNFNLVGRADLGLELFYNIVLRWPDASKIWLVMGEWELNDKDQRGPLLAAMFIDKAISLGDKTPEAYTWQAKAYVKLNKKSLAIESLHKALWINPDWQSARDLLDEINK